MAPGCLTASTVDLYFPGRFHSESGVYMECSAFSVQPLRVLRLENIGTFQKGAGFSCHKLYPHPGLLVSNSGLLLGSFRAPVNILVLS